MKSRLKMLVPTLVSVLSLTAHNIATINIWAGTDCKSVVRLTPYPAAKPGSPAVIICPGGSYFWHDLGTEGRDVALWLQSNGISAFVLEYRVGGIPAFITHNRLVTRGNRYPDMLADLQRAITLVRAGASRWNVDPGRVGAMGFSAGGHLAVMSGIYYDTRILDSIGGASTPLSVRPDFVASIYPVVSMTAPCRHRRSIRGALGERPTAAMCDSLSLEKHVHPGMPPVFLVNCLDDPTVHYHNSELLDSAMTRHGVPHRYLQFPTGGHGFGATPSKAGPDASAWPSQFLVWLRAD